MTRHDGDDEWRRAPLHLASFMVDDCHRHFLPMPGRQCAQRNTLHTTGALAAHSAAGRGTHEKPTNGTRTGYRVCGNIMPLPGWGYSFNGSASARACREWQLACAV